MGNEATTQDSSVGSESVSEHAVGESVPSRSVDMSQAFKSAQVEAKESEGAEGETAVKTQANKEPSGEGLFDGMTPEKLHESYKSLQSEFTKRSDSLKNMESQLSKFQKFGGVDNLLQWAEQLSSNPDFAQWVQTQQQRNLLGTREDVDPETQRAMEIVTRIAEAKSEEKVAELRKQLETVTNEFRNMTIEEHLDTLEENHPEYFQVRDKMAELTESWSSDKQMNPTYEDIEDLYFKALRATGRFEDYAAQMYQRKLESKKSKSTETPQTKTISAAKTQAKTIAEAFQQAKAEMSA